MKKTLRIIAILIVAVMAFGLLASCESESNQTSSPPANTGDSGGFAGFTGGKDIYNDPIKISVISISTFGQVNRMYQMAVNDQLARYPNVRVDYKDGEFDPGRQITLIEEAITQGYDCIILENMDPAASVDAIHRAEAAGIPVITNNAAQPFSINTLHVAGMDYPAGWRGGEELDKLSAGQPNRTAICLDAPAVQKPGARMGTGFEEYVNQASVSITLLETIGIENWSADNAQIAMSNMLAKYGPGEITMVYCASGDIASGAMNAIEQAGRQNDGILIWGFMGYPNELEAIRDGRMAGTMFSDTYTQYAAVFYYAMYFIATGINAVDAGYTVTPMVEQPLFPVTKANVEEVMAFSGWFMNGTLG